MMGKGFCYLGSCDISPKKHRDMFKNMHFFFILHVENASPSPLPGYLLK